jgi:hypothetical protein
MENFDVVLVTLHDQIDSDRHNLIKILEEIEDLHPNDPLPEYTRLLYLNYIYLSQLSYSIKEHLLLKDILIYKF